MVDVKIQGILKKFAIILVLMVFVSISVSKCAVFDLIDITINTPEYPDEHLQLYGGSKVTNYDYDGIGRNVYVKSGTTDELQTVTDFYDKYFKSSTTIKGFSQHIADDNYVANGIIENFSFLIEVMNASPDDHVYGFSSIIKTSIHFLSGDELKYQELFDAIDVDEVNIYKNSYIEASTKMGDDKNLYFEMKNYKLELLDIDYDVELYINEVLYGTRFNGSKIKVPIERVSEICDVKMIATNNSKNTFAVAIEEDFLFFDADDMNNLNDVLVNSKQVKALFLKNTESLKDISILSDLDLLNTLYFRGNESIKDYSALANNDELAKIFVWNINNDILYQLPKLENLQVLKIANSDMSIALNADFEKSNVVDLQFTNCHNLYFDSEYEGPQVTYERLHVDENFSLYQLQNADDCSSLRILDLNNCDNLIDIVSLKRLYTLNMLKVENSIGFDLTLPMDNMTNLVNIRFSNNAVLAKHGTESLDSIAANNNIIIAEIVGCGNYNNIKINKISD